MTGPLVMSTYTTVISLILCPGFAGRFKAAPAPSAPSVY